MAEHESHQSIVGWLRARTSPLLGGPDGTDLGAIVASIGSSLRAQGIGPDDVVAYRVPPGVDGAHLFFGISSVAAAAPLAPGLTPQERAQRYDLLQPTVLVDLTGEWTAEDSVPSAIAEPSTSAATSSIIAEPSTSAATSSIIAEPSTSAATSSIIAEPDAKATALLLSTSGTTGMPKLVALNHERLLMSATRIAELYQLETTDRALTMMPLFHIHGLVAGLLAPLVSGGSVRVVPFDAFGFGRLVADHQPTWMSAVPTMYSLICSRWSKRADEIRQAPWRFCRSSSSAMPPPLLTQIESLFGVTLSEAYGMTEAAHQIAANPIDGKRTPGSVGHPAGVQVRIDGAQKPGDRGEVLLRGATIIESYRSGGEANTRSFTDGWFRTGDQGYLDDDGRLWLTARLKEIINRGGETIAPVEIENIMLEHPAVDQCAVFALAHDVLGEVPAAVVTVDPSIPLDAAALTKFLRGRVSSGRVPDPIVVAESIPTGPTGKVQRVALAGQLGLQ